MNYYVGSKQLVYNNIMREGIREQPEKQEKASGEFPLAQPLNFLFSAIASFCTFWKVFRSWVNLPEGPLKQFIASCRMH